jgi:hypothetical protein
MSAETWGAQWLEAIEHAREAYAVFRACVPLPDFRTFCTAVINELRYDRARQKASDVGAFGAPLLGEFTHKGRSVPVVRIAHVHYLDDAPVQVTIRVVCADGRIVDVSRESRDGPPKKEEKKRAVWQPRPAQLSFGQDPYGA